MIDRENENKFYSGRRVFLYGTTRYSGKLLNLLDKRDGRWSIALDDGSYDSAIVRDITLLESQLEEKTELIKPTYEELEQKIISLKGQIIQLTQINSQLQEKTELLEQKNISLQEENERVAIDNRELEGENNKLIFDNQELELENERFIFQLDDLIPLNRQLIATNEILSEELQKSKTTILQAKDISPVKRPSFKRVQKIAQKVKMEVKKCSTGWGLRMGEKLRKFSRLKDIWQLLCIEQLFPEQIFDCYS